MGTLWDMDGDTVGHGGDGDRDRDMGVDMAMDEDIGHGLSQT